MARGEAEYIVYTDEDYTPTSLKSEQTICRIYNISTH